MNLFEEEETSVSGDPDPSFQKEELLFSVRSY